MVGLTSEDLKEERNGSPTFQLTLNSLRMPNIEMRVSVGEKSALHQNPPRRSGPRGSWCGRLISTIICPLLHQPHGLRSTERLAPRFGLENYV